LANVSQRLFKRNQGCLIVMFRRGLKTHNSLLA
jgi:hypothetical protein